MIIMMMLINNTTIIITIKKGRILGYMVLAVWVNIIILNSALS